MNAHAVETKVPAAGHQPPAAGHNPPAAEQHLSSEAPTSKQDDLIGKVATVAVIGLGVALIEVELIPGLILGAAAAFLPNLMPKLGGSLRPAMKSTVRASYKFAQKTREAFAEASEQVQDMVAEAKLEQEPAAQPVVDGARRAAARKA
jgi:predicted trehalose synthase